MAGVRRRSRPSRIRRAWPKRASPPSARFSSIVDTDATVPALVNRLRVDAFTSSGVWYDSRDFRLEEPSQWPASFGVYSPVAGQGGAVTLRLRGYADGNVRDYRGERYQARPEGGPPSEIVETPPPPAGEAPRLLGENGSDITPATEPEPLLAIDAIIELEVPADVVKLASVVLRGACFGTMANLLDLETCVDTENVLVPAPSLTLGSDLTLPTHSMQGKFGAPVPCKAAPRPNGVAPDGTPLYDEEVCVGGGTFVFGRYPNNFPERIVVIEPFLMDKYEVTVAAFREALLHGLAPTNTPPENESPIPGTADWESQAGLAFLHLQHESDGARGPPGLVHRVGCRGSVLPVRRRRSPFRGPMGVGRRRGGSPEQDGLPVGGPD